MQHDASLIIINDVLNVNKFYSRKTQFLIQAEGPAGSGGE